MAAALPSLIDEAAAQLQPMSDDEIFAKLTALLATIGVGLPQTEKTEWLAATCIVVSTYPAALASEALDKALTGITSIRELTKFVDDYCGQYPAIMKRRHAGLVRLQAIAEGRDDV